MPNLYARDMEPVVGAFKVVPKELRAEKDFPNHIDDILIPSSLPSMSRRKMLKDDLGTEWLDTPF